MNSPNIGDGIRFLSLDVQSQCGNMDLAIKNDISLQIMDGFWASADPHGVF
jgi:hypothetical protein